MPAAAPRLQQRGETGLRRPARAYVVLSSSSRSESSAEGNATGALAVVENAVQKSVSAGTSSGGGDLAGVGDKGVIVRRAPLPPATSTGSAGHPERSRPNQAAPTDAVWYTSRWLT